MDETKSGEAYQRRKHPRDQAGTQTTDGVVTASDGVLVTSGSIINVNEERRVRANNEKTLLPAWEVAPPLFHRKKNGRDFC